MRIALIGRGPWAARYLATLRSLRGVRVTAIVSRGRPGAAFRGVRWLPDVHRLDRRKVDAAIVVTAAEAHARTTVPLLRLGIPVLVEKPMALSLRDARRMYDAARQRPSLLCVAHTHLYSEAFEHLLAEVQDAGGMIQADSGGGNRGPHRSRCSPLWDYGAHDVSMLLALTRALPREVWAHEFEALEPGRNVQIDMRFLRLREPAAGRVAVRTRVGNGFAVKERRLEVWTPRGRFVYDDLAADKLMFHPEDGETAPVALPDRALPLTRTASYFVNAVRRGKRHDPGARLGVLVCGVLARVERTLARKR